MNDEGFREIQLNGKQLVFLFMAAAVISVVIFLLGVLVGRDVRSDRPVTAETAANDIAPDPAVSPPARSATPAPQPAAEPPAPAENLSYPERLAGDDTPTEKLKPSSSEAPPSLKTTPKPAASRSSAQSQTVAPPPHPVSASVAEPTGAGFAVQVAAYKDRNDAEMLAKRLTGKGYPAFVMAPVKGAPTALYRVRIGKYKDQREAEAVSHRLEAEEQMKPWIAR